MLCMICKKNEATVHMTDIHDNQKHEMHICPECAKKQGILIKAQDALAGLIEKFGEAAAKEAEKIPNLRCPKCGATYEDFRKRGRLGCPHDYEVFEEALKPLLVRIHGATEHVGKAVKKPAVSAGQTEAMKRTEKIQRLRQELERAVSAEQYERAARLRDEVQKLEGNRDAT